MATEIQGYDPADGTYTVSFDEDCIRTTLTASGDAVDAWLDDIYRIHRRRLHRLVVGLDVEWRPASGYYNDYYYTAAPPPAAVLQLCVGRRCLIFQLLHADYLPDALFDFLADGRFTFVGVGVDCAPSMGWRWRAEDLRRLAASELGKPALRRAGLHALVWEVMGPQMDKPHHVRVSAWDARRLSLDQLKYACADAFASFEVGRMLYDGDY